MERTSLVPLGVGGEWFDKSLTIACEKNLMMKPCCIPVSILGSFLGRRIHTYLHTLTRTEQPNILNPRD